MERIAHTIPEFCELSSLGRTFIYEQIKTGNLPVIRAGRRVLIADDTGRKFLKDRETSAPTPYPRRTVAA